MDIVDSVNGEEAEFKVGVVSVLKVSKREFGLSKTNVLLRIL